MSQQEPVASAAAVTVTVAVTYESQQASPCSELEHVVENEI